MPNPEYEREQRRREAAIERLRQLRATVMEQNQDLSPAEGDALAGRYVRDVLDDMVREGKIRFEDAPATPTTPIR